MTQTFADLVSSNWTLAVQEASSEFVRWKHDLLASLNSANPEVRSAAIAALNEANFAEAHDAVASLAKDENPHVRDEVFEYLLDFGRPEDARLLLAILKNQEHLFVVSEILNRLCNRTGPVLDEDDNEEEIRANTMVWENILRERGYVT